MPGVLGGASSVGKQAAERRWRQNGFRMDKTSRSLWLSGSISRRFASFVRYGFPRSGVLPRLPLNGMQAFTTSGKKCPCDPRFDDMPRRLAGARWDPWAAACREVAVAASERRDAPQRRAPGRAHRGKMHNSGVPMQVKRGYDASGPLRAVQRDRQGDCSISRKRCTQLKPLSVRRAFFVPADGACRDKALGSLVVCTHSNRRKECV